MKEKNSIRNQIGEMKSYREQKSEELFDFVDLIQRLESSEEDNEKKRKLKRMLNISAENLIDCQSKWMIGEHTKSSLKDFISEAFFYLQDAINSIEDDEWDNEWRCDFSNRIMHKSLPLQSFKKNLINSQRTIYNLLGALVDKPFDFLVEYNTDGFDISDMKFRIVRSEWKP